MPEEVGDPWARHALVLLECKFVYRANKGVLALPG